MQMDQPYGMTRLQAYDQTRPPYEAPSVDWGGGGGGLMGVPTTPAPTTPAPAPVPGAPPVATLPPPVTAPAGPSTPVPAPQPATPAPPQVTAPVAGPDPNWQANVQRPASQPYPTMPAPRPATPTQTTPLVQAPTGGGWQGTVSNQQLPPMPSGSGAVNMPPSSQAINYGASAPLGTNPYIGNAPPVQGTGAAAVGDFRGIFGEGDRGAATRTVQANELSGNQLNDLIRGDSQLIRNARLAAAQRSSEGGMLMSSMAAGASQRASIDAAQPFAMQQADAYGRTASENMAAQNADNLADQGQYRDLGARDIALRAQMEDASLGRQFQGSLASNEQAWRSGESFLDREFQQGESAANRNFQSGERAAGQNWQSGESAYDRAWRSGEQSLDRYQQTSERIGNQNWQSGETAQDRAFRDYQAGLDRTQQTNERLGNQDFNWNLAGREQDWRSGETALDRYQQTNERIAGQDFQSGETAYDRAFREYQMGLDRAQQTNERLSGQDFSRSMSEAEQQWRSGEGALDRTATAEQAAAARNEQRYGSYFNMVANREAQLSTILSGIYSNPNLTPQQQQAAAENARALMGSVVDSYNTVMASGIPPIFANPYPMTFPPAAP